VGRLLVASKQKCRKSGLRRGRSRLKADLMNREREELVSGGIISMHHS
jgi:hypothetical protein